MIDFNILHINSARSWGGGEQQTLYLAQGLQGKGHRVLIVGQPQSALVSRAREEGLRVFPVRMRGEWDLLAAWKLAKIIKREHIQVVHLHEAHAHALGLLATSIARKPKVVLSRKVCFPIRKNPLSKLKYRTKRIDRIIAVSEGVKSLLIKGGIRSEKIIIIHDGIDIEKFRKVRNNRYLYNEFDLDSKGPLVGMVAALSSTKDHQNFLEAAARVKEELSRVRFLVVGEGELRRELEYLTKKLELEKSVVFTGFRNDIPQILSVLNLFVLSSRSEALPNSILDAMASGLPVVATKVGGIPEIVKDGVNGILVPPRDPRALARAIITLLKDKKRASRMGLAGQKIVKDFTVARMVAKTEKVYRQLIFFEREDFKCRIRD